MADIILVSDNENEENSASNSNSKKQKEPDRILRDALNGKHSQMVVSVSCPSQKNDPVQTSTFDNFISFCKKQTEDPDMLKIIKHLRKSYTQANREYTQSAKFLEFTQVLQAKIQENPSNVFVFVKELSDELKAYKAHSNIQAITDNHINHTSDKPLNGNFSGEGKTCESNLRNYSASLPSTSAVVVSDSRALESAGTVTSCKKKEPNEKHIAFLEWQLRRLEKKIKKLAEKELSMDDLEDDESNYILEDRYKRRAVKVWKTLCKYQGREALSGRATDRKFNYAGSRYPEINKMTNRFLNKHKAFPDFTDIVKLVETAVTYHKLPMKESQVYTEAQNVFTDVGKMLRVNRLTEFEELLCSCDPEDDPAKKDEELAKALQESAVTGQKKIEEVLNTYTAKQQELMNDRKKMDNDNHDDNVDGRCATPDNLRDDCTSEDSEQDGKLSEDGDFEQMAEELKDEVDNGDLHSREANTMDDEVDEELQTGDEENEDVNDDIESLSPSNPTPVEFIVLDTTLDNSQEALQRVQSSSDAFSEVMTRYREHSDKTAQLNTEQVINCSPVSVRQVQSTHSGFGMKRKLDYDLKDDNIKIKRERTEFVSLIEENDVITISDSD